MKTINPIIFLGVSDNYIEHAQLPFPHGSTDFFGIGTIKSYYIYPLPGDNFTFHFLIHKSLTTQINNNEKFITINSHDGTEILSCKAEREIYTENAQKQDEYPAPPVNKANIHDSLTVNIENFGQFTLSDWTHIGIRTKMMIPEPGIYKAFYIDSENKPQHISDLCFHYSRAKKLNASDLYGIRSNLLVSKSVLIELKCDNCGDSIRTYTGSERDYKSESKGCIWNEELPDFFTCKCGKMSHTLKYYKENLHTLLTQSIASKTSNKILSQSQLYSYKAVRTIVENFLELIDNTDSENEVQRFIEGNPVLLSPLNAKRIFFKPTILGKFFTDFVIYDANHRIIFIEIESPTTALFKKNGHPTAPLNHAYDQVKDWLLEYSSHPQAILESLDLKIEDISSVKGLVIAGKLSQDDVTNYRKHIKKNENALIDFMTFDKLAASVLNLADTLL